MSKFKRITSLSTAVIMAVTFAVSATGCSAREFFAKDGPGTVTETDPAKDGVITNAEWLAMVNDAFGMQVDETAEDGELDAAKEWGVISEDEVFDMDAPVTDQFATKTLMRATGFVDTDASDEEVIQAAVSHGIINPGSSLSDPGNAAEALGNATHEWSHMEYDYAEDVQYADNVTDLSQKVKSDDFSVSNEDVVVMSADAAADIGVNSVFVLPPNDQYKKGIALKAVSVTDNGNGTTAIKSVPASRDEVYSKIYVQGSFVPDADSVVTRDDDAEIIVENRATGMSFTAPHASEAGIMPLSSFNNNTYIRQLTTDEYDLDGTDLSISKTINGVKYSVGVKDIHLNAMIDYTLTKINEMHIAVDYTTNVDINYEKDLFDHSFELGGHNYLDDAEAIVETYEIGDVSFNIYYGISVDFTVYLLVSASGAVSVEISQTHTMGFEWSNNQFRPIKESGTPQYEFKLSCEVGLNLKLEISLNLYLIKDIAEHKLFSASIIAGPRLSGEVTVRNDMTCINVTGYIGLDFDVELDLIFMSYSFNEPIWEADNSPFKFLDLHYEITTSEGFHKADECTYDVEETTTAVTTVPVTSQKLVLGTTYLSLETGTRTRITLRSTPVDPSALIWESSNPSVVSVDNAGNITTMQQNGSAIITVRTPDGKQTAKCTVKVNAAIVPVIRTVPGSDYQANVMCA